ncbi:MAG TPA: hypothetical protein VM638_02895 [Actinomycetota bacterium]|nr:hypothetical protein [Actinomycetota bacterium]
MQRAERIELEVRRPVGAGILRGMLTRIRDRRQERRELAAWFRDNPPEIGRSTGCRV